MQPDDLVYWLELIAGALIVLGGWLLNVGRKYQALKDAIDLQSMTVANMSGNIARIEGRLDSEVNAVRHEIAVVDRERSESASKIYARLDEISRSQAAQDAQITHIAATCNRTNQMLVDMLAGTRHGGNQ